MKALLLIAVSVAVLVVPRVGSAADVQAGRHVYQTVCTTCHGPTGKGLLPGMPDFRKADGVLTQPDSILLHRIEHGFKSPGSPIPMPPKGGDASLTTQDIKNAIAYLHHNFNVQSREPAASSGGPVAESEPSSGSGSAGLQEP